jgi:pimeloyl-ACP methyl ester carboxylesterase
MIPPGALHFAPPSGARAGTRLIYLHGAASGPWVWAEGFAQRLAALGHPGIALPLSGQHATLADYLAKVREVLDEPAVLVGHSLGALIAQRLLDHPQVRGAVLLAPVPPEGLWWSNSRLAFSDPSLWGEVAKMTDPKAVPSARLLRGLFGPAMNPEAGWRHMARLSTESTTALLESQMPQPVTPGWIHGRRVLVMGAEEDRLIPANAVRRCAAWHGATAEFLHHTGHLLMLDVGWEGVADRIGTWLRC